MFNRKKCVTVITGLQWGDEGKGKATTKQVENCKYVVRSIGGANAGHTVIVNGEKHVFHLLPSSILYKDICSIIGPGCVIELPKLFEEIQKITGSYRISRDRLQISDCAHIVFPYHKQLDILLESLKENPIGTTARGIGPAYSDKVNRVGIRVKDLLYPEKKLKAKIREAIKIPNSLFEIYGKDEWKISAEEIYKICMQYAVITKIMANTQETLKTAIDDSEQILIEGAQAYSLDIDHGDYPFVTSSSPNAAGLCSAAGIGPMYVKEVIGVIKSYSSRVGEGPFPTELPSVNSNDPGSIIRDLGNEYGSTTKRPRRCGWLDLRKIKKATFTNSVTSLCVNHIDTIGEIGRKLGVIKVCYSNSLETGEPIYIEFQGWKMEDVKNAKTFNQLPQPAQCYINFIEHCTGVPVKYIGTGPKDTDVIIKSKTNYAK